MSYAEASAFIKTHPHWPAQRRLLASLEKTMPSDLPDREVLSWFSIEKPPESVEGADHVARALIRSGRIKEVRILLRKFWENGRMSREEQQAFFHTYNAYLNAKSHKERLETLLEQEQYENAKAVARVLGKGWPELMAARIALRRDGAGNVDTLIAQVPAALAKDPGLLRDRLTWRRLKEYNDGAIEILSTAPPLKEMRRPDAWWKERHILARRMIEQGQYEQAYRLAAGHRQEEGLSFAQAEWLAGWLALRFVNKPQEAFLHFEKLYNNVQTPVSRSRAAYWAGRSSAVLKRPDIAAQWYAQAARYRTTFYGQTAAAALGLPPIQPPAQTQALLQKPDRVRSQAFESRDLVRAARLLHKDGMRKEAGLFLREIGARSNSAEDYVQAAALATELKQSHIAIRIAADAEKTGIELPEEYSYPDITRYLKANSAPVEWALVHALVRQESRFDGQATSPAGARGLMQLMPATAKEVAGRAGIRHKNDWLTDRPEHNIILGIRYLSQMLDRYDGHYALAIAAYNAGPGRVDRWIKEFGDPRSPNVDLLDWIERIPVYETRNYVQRVLEGTYTYRNRLRGIQTPPKTPIHIAYAGP